MVACVGHASVPLVDGEDASYLPLIDMAGIVSELDLAAHYLSPGRIPLPVICGVDMNSTTDEIAHTLVTTGRINPRDPIHVAAAKHGCNLPEHLGHNLRLASAYTTVTGKEPDYTNLNSSTQFRKTIDYVFHSEDTLDVTSCRDTYPLSPVFGVPELPNTVIPSDHIPLVCNMRFKRK